MSPLEMELPQPRMSADFRTSMDHHNQMMDLEIAQTRRKRKADTQDTNSERLSKRLSVLNLGELSLSQCAIHPGLRRIHPSACDIANLRSHANISSPTPEQDGAKLYVPVEKSQQPSQTSLASSPIIPSPTSTSPSAPDLPAPMQVDDTKHKVYIYSLDDELSSSSPSDDDDSLPVSPTGNRISLLPDLSDHLRKSRIPRSILANSDGELAGMQLVLYREPAALSVPEEYDGVRRAVVEARERIREKQRIELLGLGGGVKEVGEATKGLGDVPMTMDRGRRGSIGVQSLPTIPETNVLTLAEPQEEDDADAMDLD